MSTYHIENSVLGQLLASDGWPSLKYVWSSFTHRILPPKDKRGLSWFLYSLALLPLELVSIGYMAVLGIAWTKICFAWAFINSCSLTVLSVGELCYISALASAELVFEALSFRWLIFLLSVAQLLLSCLSTLLSLPVAFFRQTFDKEMMILKNKLNSVSDDYQRLKGFSDIFSNIKDKMTQPAMRAGAALWRLFTELMHLVSCDSLLMFDACLQATASISHVVSFPPLAVFRFYQAQQGEGQSIIAPQGP